MGQRSLICALDAVGLVCLSGGAVTLVHGTFLETESTRAAIYLFLGAMAIAAGLCLNLLSLMKSLKESIKTIESDFSEGKPPSTPFLASILFLSESHWQELWGSAGGKVRHTLEACNPPEKTPPCAKPSKDRA